LFIEASSYEVQPFLQAGFGDSLQRNPVTALTDLRGSVTEDVRYPHLVEARFQTSEKKYVLCLNQHPKLKGGFLVLLARMLA
jgi:hypothetical protein